MVVVVVHGHADVVEDAGGPEQLALLGAVVVEAGGRQAVEHRGRQLPHVRGRARRRGRSGARGCATDSLRTSSNSSSSPSRRSKNTPSRRPASVTSIASKPPSSRAVASTSAPPRITSPRSYLMPFTSPRFEAGRDASSLDQLLQRVAREHEALDVDVRDARARFIAAAARLRIVPPMPTSRPPPLPPAERLELWRPRGRAAPSSASTLAFSSGRKRSLTRTAPSRQRVRVDELPALDPQRLDAPAADVEPEAVLDRGRVRDREPAVAGLLRAR